MSEVNKFYKTPYLEEMRDRVTFAFKNSRVFDNYLRLFNVEVEELQEALRQLMQDRSIDTARGVQLDIIGDIVGQPRRLVNASNLPFFGFLGHQRAESYGDEDLPAVGGYYWDENQPQAGDYILDDGQYRTFIKAKIIKNNSKGTPEDIIRFIQFVFNAKVVQITEDEGAHVTILVDNTLNDFEQSLLYYFIDEGGYTSYFIPKVLGVEYGFGTLPPDQFFGYLGAPNADGYGTYNESTGEVEGGGIYSSLVF